MARDPADDDYVDVHEDHGVSSEEDEGDGKTSTVSTEETLKRGLQGRVFIVSTARPLGGHRPSCVFDGDLFEVCQTAAAEGGKSYLQRVLQPSDDAAALSLSLRYEPPSPKFSRSHPELTSYRVKLLQGSQFIYLHRGLPKVCLVDLQARCLSWGQLQLVLRDTQQLQAVLGVLRHADVQHAEVWSPQVSRLWLHEGEQPATSEGTSATTVQQSAAAAEDAGQTTTQPGEPATSVGNSEPGATPAEPSGRAPAETVPPKHWSVWTLLSHSFPIKLLGAGAGKDQGRGQGLGALYGALLLAGSAALLAGVLWQVTAHRRRS